MLRYGETQTDSAGIVDLSHKHIRLNSYDNSDCQDGRGKKDVKSHIPSELIYFILIFICTAWAGVRAEEATVHVDEHLKGFMNL